MGNARVRGALLGPTASLITNTLRGSHAERDGLLAGDVVVDLERRHPDIHTRPDAWADVSFQPNGRVVYTVIRAGALKELTVEVTEGKSGFNRLDVPVLDSETLGLARNAPE